MSKKIVVRLFILQKKLEHINCYSAENCFALLRYSIALEALLETLLKISRTNFDPVFNQFSGETQIYCRLCCEFTDTENTFVAFNTGLNRLNADVKKCLFLLVTHHLQPPELLQK